MKGEWMEDTDAGHNSIFLSIANSIIIIWTQTHTWTQTRTHTHTWTDTCTV